MFSKILIANRGEIACRIIVTARRLGIQTVAVYSDADAQAKHVAMADEAWHLGPPAAAESYLRGDKIIAIARKSGAEAIHPGYGFLSENPEFVTGVEAVGLRFIGPSSGAIRAMGLKDAAKALMQKAGVPVTPGYHGEAQDMEFLAAEAEKIGWPVLIKARAGGGGKGMRRAERREDFAAALSAAQSEGLASFGDGTCLIEKYLPHPRHIEIQIFGDDHGNVVHLFERDCSLQRRHQKVIEEAPAPDMPAEMRAAMGEAAVRAAKAIGYSGAGTVEFIVDASEGLRADRFYFMEMNTRLQVEHPVTEAITGEDLVEWQFRVASGERLPRSQDQLAIRGWAFEARLYAEDVPKGFLPATGRLSQLEFPPLPARIESGVREGDEISPWYDPMIAKLVCHGPDRPAALGALRQALRECCISGTVTNLDFLSSLAAHPGFAAGEVDTGLIDRDLEALLQPQADAALSAALAALIAGGFVGTASGAEPEIADPWQLNSGFRLFSSSRQIISFSRPAAELTLLRDEGQISVENTSSGHTLCLELTGAGRAHLSFRHEGVTRQARWHQSGPVITVHLAGRRQEFTLADPLARSEESTAAGDHVFAPMSGLLKSVHVASGAGVASGDALLVMEAMKMEHTLSAPRDGVVALVAASAGAQVSEGDLLLSLWAEDADD